MLTKVVQLLKLLLKSSLVLPLYAIDTLCTIGSEYKMKNYFPLDLGKFWDLVPLTSFDKVETPCKRPMSL